MADMTEFVEKILGGVQGYVQRSIAPLLARLEAVEKREPIAGDRGEPGPAGKDGAPGERGADGLNGKDGAPGAAGATGEPGQRGEKGDPGERGEQGPPGERGLPGEKGADGINGKDGAPGERGEKGLDGRDGMEGQPGRDAVHVDILDGIEPAKKYQRGTWASYRGGLVRSFKATEPLPEGGDLERAGWHVVVRGVADVAVEFGDDGRTIGLALRYTDGSVVMKSAQFPVVIDRGVWKEAAYERGDATTWGGSSWIAQRKTAATEQPGDDSGAWRLSVKKGRDGRDGVRGEKGERGAEGRAGKDLTQMTADGRRY